MQSTSDPQAAASVQYDNGSNAPVDCGLDDSGRPLPCSNDSQFVADEQGQMDAPDVDSAFAPDYFAYQDYQYYPPFYAGVSLWPPYGYWPGYAWGGWGFGWPYYGFGINIGFGFGFGFGWHDHFHGPWRYDGHGHYWDNHREFARNDRFSNHGDYRNFAGRSPANVGGNRSLNNQRGFSRGVNTAQAGGAFRSNEARSVEAFGANRGALRSSSYYSAARGGVSNGQSFNRGNVNSNVRGSSFASGNRANGYGLNSNPHVASMPNRGYSTQNYRSNGTTNRSYAGAQRGGYGSPQRYGSSGGYSRSSGAVRSSSYAHTNYSGHGSSAPRVSASHESSGGHSGGGHGGENGHH
jgi:hypothetical protein